MKKSLFIALLFVQGLTMGQEEKLTITKGTWAFGGEMSFSSITYENSFHNNVSYTRFVFTPKVGYFISNNLELGSGIGYAYSKNDYENSDEYSKSNTFSISPYIKKYFPLNENFSFSLQGELNFSKYKTEYFNDINYSKGNSFFVGLRPGILYFFTKKIAMHANIGSIGYASSKSEYNSNSDESTSSSISFNLNSSSLLFGLSYYL